MPFGMPRNPFGGDYLPLPDAPSVNLPPMAAAIRQPKFFGKGGAWKDVLGIIADAIAGAGGRSGMYAPMKLRMMEHLRDQEDEERKASRDEATWRARQDYEQKTKSPYRWETNDGSLAELGSDGQPRIVYRDPTPKVDWVQSKDPVTGAISLIPRVASSGATPGAAPTSKQEYDALPPGSPYIAPDGSHRVKGGPTPQASGGFL